MKVEVRGPTRLLENFSKEFRQSDQVEEITPEPTDEQILDKLSTVFETDLAALTLIGAKFNSTNLPHGSSLALANNEGIKRDLNDSLLRAELIDVDNLSDLQYLKFHHRQTDVQVKLSVERSDEGFYFKIDDSNLPENEKENIRQLLSDKVGISFNSLYPYDAQHHRGYIINQILTGNVDVYQKYYDVLDEDGKDFIDRFVNDVGQDSLYCYECHDGFYEYTLETRNCPECGNTLYRGQPGLTIEVQRDEIQSAIFEAFQSFNKDISSQDGTRLLQLNFEKEEISNNKYIRATFHLAESAGTAMDSHWYEFYIYCLGNGDTPERISEYLLDCVLVTYGGSQIRGRDDFGTISLYQLLQGESPEQEFIQAVKKSRSRLRNRVRQQANDAKERLHELQQKVNNGVLENASVSQKNELKAEYDYDDFERDVYYLLKSMFLFTERWGREGLKESDGCIILPDENNTYFVASYDPKLTYDARGYDLGADEKNKAAYYILSESNDEYISDILKEGGSIDCHIFISDLFREGQFEYVSNTVQDWFALAKGDSENVSAPVVFLSLESLLQLHDIFDSNYSFILEYPKVQKAFRNEIQNQFATREDYRVIDSNRVEKVAEKVLDARSTASKKKAAKGYSDRN